MGKNTFNRHLSHWSIITSLTVHTASASVYGQKPDLFLAVHSASAVCEKWSSGHSLVSGQCISWVFDMFHSELVLLWPVWNDIVFKMKNGILTIPKIEHEY